MIDASSTASFLLDRQARVLHRNAAAEALVADGDALVVQSGCLGAREPRSRELVRDFIKNAASLPDSKFANVAAKAILLSRASDRRPLQLLGSPLPLADRKRSGADLVLLVTDPETPVNFHDETLCSLYRLTAAEVEVANGLLTGYRLDEIANLRGVSVGTVRIQVKSILNKTGSSRQSDLIRLFMSLSPAAIVH